jgi:hypothetical protein
MERNPPYVRISELLNMAKHGPVRPADKCDHALSLIEEALCAIEAMSIAEREDLISRIEGLMLVDKFDARGHSALWGLQRYCVAECLYANPNWTPSKGATKKPLPWAY